ncbi:MULTISPECIES: hypothetical protein [unclassified Mesorhizobium]|uniref:hypothetical protein n=2 Tax=Mesorhizobium TaxID=68287 RepID=UPI0013DEF8B5|nr:MULTISPECIES: hypothetical protein [unclassified Mesorhizobium]
MALQNGYQEQGQAQRATGFVGSTAAAPTPTAPAAAPTPAPVTTTVTPAPTTPAATTPPATTLPATTPAPTTPTTRLGSVFQMPGMPPRPEHATKPKSPKKVCYTKGTEVRMADGSWKPVETIALFEEVMLGGMVIGRGEALSDNAFRYKGQIVTGSHAVFSDEGRFSRVEDTAGAEPFDIGRDGWITVYPLVTTNHLMVLRTHISADFAETDTSVDQLPDQRLGELNADRDRLECLDWIVSEGTIFGNDPVPARGSLSAYQELVAGEGWKPVPAA